MIEESLPGSPPGRPEKEKQFMTRIEAAHYLNVDLRTIDRYAANGQLTKYKKLNNHIRYDREEVKGLAKVKPAPRRPR